MKNTCPFYVIFQVLKIHLIKMCKIEHQIFYFLLFLLDFTLADIPFFINFQKFIQYYLQKRFLSEIFFFNIFTLSKTFSTLFLNFALILFPLSLFCTHTFFLISNFISGVNVRVGQQIYIFKVKSCLGQQELLQQFPKF